MNELLRGEVTAARRLSEHVRELDFRPDAALEFQPGQWLSLRLPVGEKPPLNRAYSLADAPAPDGRLTLCFDRVEGGLGSGYLWGIAPGDVVEFTGPHGNFTLPEGDAPLLFVARYTGIVPFRAMLHALAVSGSRPTHLVYTATDPAEFIYRAELDALAARAPWLTVAFAEDGGEFTALDAWTPPAPDFLPYACGLREFTKPVRDYVIERFGLDRRAVRMEHFS